MTAAFSIAFCTEVEAGQMEASENKGDTALELTIPQLPITVLRFFWSSRVFVAGSANAGVAQRGTNTPRNKRHRFTGTSFVSARRLPSPRF